MSTYDDAAEWIRATWDPEMPLRAWWRQLADSGWGFPAWPRHRFGRGLDPLEAQAGRHALIDAGVLGPPVGVATLMVAPTLIELGEDDLLDRHLAAVVYGEEIWCQLFSEPNAGSDLAGVRTRAVRDGDQWVVNGQKVWTSAGHLADFAILLARTNPDLPKHRGLSFFVLPMRQPGVDVRPLRQMNGLAEFNEVFMTDAVVPPGGMIGAEGDGWRVAMAVLAHERASVDADRDSTGGLMTRLDLDAPVGSFVGSGAAETVEAGSLPVGERARTLLLDALRETGAAADPVVRQRAARVLTLIEIAGHASGAFHPSLGKNLTTKMLRELRDCALAMQGASGTLVDGDARFDGAFQQLALTLPGLMIAGGSEEIQRNIIGERLLGLPGEPRVDKDVPFRDVPSN